MNKPLVLIVVLMSASVAGIIALQLFWNYQNYNNTVRNFKHDINEALTEAAQLEVNERYGAMVNQVKVWLADTSFITITCDNKNRYRETVFHMSDTHPLMDSRPVSMGINSFKESLAEITPEAKSVFIEHFANNTVMGDLKKGIVYFYTQRLGDSLSAIFEKKNVNLNRFEDHYRTALENKGIFASFKLNSRDTTDSAFITRTINAALRAPYQKEYVYATLEKPSTYFLKQMKYVILSTLLLIVITVICFGYTVKTLLSQYKLAILKDDFIHNVMHELNTPIASIGITSEALKTFDHPPEKQREYLEIIGQQTKRLSSITEQIINTDRFIIAAEERQVISIIALIERAVEILAVRIHAHQAQINIKCDAAISLHADAESLVNVFINIIDNSLKYSPHGSAIEISVIHQNQEVAIAFADHGGGIAPEYQKRVFEKFFRVPKGKTHDVKGYGLGLSYVQQVVASRRGKVYAKDNSPKGTVILIQLPIAG